MRKNSVKRAIKKTAKVAIKNQTATVATTAVVSGFAVFGVIESAIIIKDKAKAKLEEIKAKKEAKKNEDNTNNNNDNSATTEPKEDEKNENNTAPQQPEQKPEETNDTNEG